MEEEKKMVKNNCFVAAHPNSLLFFFNNLYQHPLLHHLSFKTCEQWPLGVTDRCGISPKDEEE